MNTAVGDPLLASAATIRGDLRDLMINSLIHQTKLWRDMPQAEQIETAKQLDAVAADLVARVATLIATQGRHGVVATLERVTIDAEVKAILTVPHQVAAELIPMTKQAVVIMARGAENFMGERAPAATMPDQRSLPMDVAAPSARGAVVGAQPPKPSMDLIDALTGPERTLPETIATLKLQQQALVEGRRAAQMFPAGTTELPLPLGMERVETPRGVFHFNPEEIDPVSIIAKSKEARENEVLGYGPYSKIDVIQAMGREGAGEVCCAVEWADDGTEIVAVLTLQQWADDVAAVLAKSKAPNSAIHVVPLEIVIKARMEALEAAQRGMSGGGGGVVASAATITIVHAGGGPAAPPATPNRRGKRPKRATGANGHDPDQGQPASAPERKKGSPFA